MSTMVYLSWAGADCLRILHKLQPISDCQIETKDTLQHFSTDLEDQLADLWTAINEREDLLEDLVHKKQNEDAELAWMLQHDVQVKERELIEQADQLQKSEQLLEQRQGLIDELRDEIADLERDQAKSMQMADRLEQLRTQHEELEKEAAAKTALVVELQAKLQESKSMVTSQTEDHEKKTEALHKLIDEQVARAKEAQVQAVENAQCETLREMNNIKTDIENRLNHALEQRATLQKELDAAKAHVSTLEKDANLHTEKMAFLEAELEKAKSADTGLREDAKQRDEAHRAELKEQSERVKSLQSEVANWEQKFDNLTSNARAYDKAAFIVLRNLKQWTQQHAVVQELASEMAKGQSEDQQRVDSRFEPLMEMHLLQKAVMRYCQDQEAAVSALTRVCQDDNDDESITDATAGLSLGPGLAESQHLGEASKSLAEAVLDKARRVTLRSPTEIAPHPRPPSVNTEQERRRMADPPKSIMKTVPYNIPAAISAPNSKQQFVQGEELQQFAKGGRRSNNRDVSKEESKMQSRGAFKSSLVQGGTMLNHGPYNRPVARSNGRLEGSVDVTMRGSTQKPASSVEAPGQRGEVRLIDSRKHQEAFGPNQGISRKRTKRTNTTTPAISTPRPSQPEGSVEDPPTAPRKRNQKIVDAQPASPSCASQFSQAVHRSQTLAGMLGKTQGTGPQSSRMSSGAACGKHLQGHSQGPPSLFYQHRHSGNEGEDSQDSIALSQDALDRSEASLLMARRFSGMP